MNTIIPKNQRYLPHTLDTIFHTVKTYRTVYYESFAVRRCKFSKSSLGSVIKDFMGQKSVLIDISHSPLIKQPKIR